LIFHPALDVLAIDNATRSAIDMSAVSALPPAALAS
jgi:hypothetical protein